MRWDSGNEHRSGLITMKSAKYSTMDFTTSWSSASARRSSDDFLMMLLKSVLVRTRSASLFEQVRPTNVVFAVFWFSKLVYEELYAVRRRSEETKAAQMAHLLPFWVANAVGEVDRVVQQSRLGGGRGHDWDLAASTFGLNSSCTLAYRVSIK